MKISCTLLMLPVSLMLAGGAACADDMLITYRSGNSQTLHLAEPSSTIVSISYQEKAASAVDQPAHLPTKSGALSSVDKTAPPEIKNSATPQASGKPNVRIEWAPPAE